MLGSIPDEFNISVLTICLSVDKVIVSIGDTAVIGVLPSFCAVSTITLRVTFGAVTVLVYPVGKAPSYAFIVY